MDIVQEKTGQKAEELRGRMDWLQGKVGTQARIATEKVKNYARNNPMKVFLGGIILGLIIGTMVSRNINIKIEDRKKHTI